MTTPPPGPGWHPDPSGQPQLRYWDGIQWTSSTQLPGAPAASGMGTGAKVALAVGGGVVVLVALLAAAGLLVGVAGFSTGSSDSLTATAPFEAQEPRPSPVMAGPCAYYPEGQAPARPVSPPSEQDVATRGEYEVALATSLGRITFLADAAEVPCTLGSLRALARAGYFDGTRCHRLTTSGISVLQCGDPTGSGSGGPGYVFDDEALEGAQYPRGTVAMANRGPGTNGSQFFLVYADTMLPPNYTPIGRITSGIELVEQVAQAGTDESNGMGDGRPRTPVVLEAVTVAER